MPPLTVHHLGYSQSERIVWTCEDLGIDYELKKYDRAPVLSGVDLVVCLVEAAAVLMAGA